MSNQPFAWWALCAPEHPWSLVDAWEDPALNGSSSAIHQRQKVPLKADTLTLNPHLWQHYYCSIATATVAISAARLLLAVGLLTMGSATGTSGVGFGARRVLNAFNILFLSSSPMRKWGEGMVTEACLESM